MKKSKTPVNIKAFGDSSKLVRDLVNKAKTSFQANLCNSLSDSNSGSRNYWHILKQLLGKKFSSGFPTLKLGNDFYVTDEEKSAMFLKLITSKFRHEYDTTIIPDFASRTNVNVEDITITPDKVRTLLLNLDSSKQGGEDEINNKLLKLVACSLDKPLCKLLNILIQHGVFPDSWKLGVVIPIFKNKGSKMDANNYRPVTLLNSMSKILEKVIYDELLSHLLQNKLLYSKQSGFLPGHNTEKQLLHIVHTILTNFDANKITRGVFLDIAGAFDAVPHFLLIKKLQAYGIKGKVLSLLYDYLKSRTVKVRVNGSYSDESKKEYINSGVPQGSILGPLLFLIYINDLSEVILNCDFYLYADDCSLFLPVLPGQSEPNSSKLIQEDLNRISDWAETWKLNFKAAKSKEIIFHSSRVRTIDYDKLILGGDFIPRERQHKHLGLFLDENLNFQYHISETIVKCNALLNPLMSLKCTLQSSHLEKIYVSFILPHLEYCSIVFDSANYCFLNKLDQVHYRAACIISGCMPGTSRVKVLNCLGWLSLKSRRDQKKCILMFICSPI